MNTSDDYHQQRRLKILKAHPEIRALLKHDPKSITLIMCFVLLQIVMAVTITQTPIWVFILLTVFIGSPISFLLLVMIHEVTHNTMSPSKTTNNILGLVANLPLLLPVAMSFKKYHLLHHRFLGIAKYDADVPTEFEKKYFLSNISGKVIWLLLQPIFYSFRPLLVLPMKMNRWEIANVITQSFFVAGLYFTLGFAPIGYMLIAFYFSLTCSPYFARYITEHYVRDTRQETSSYYGPLNRVICNFGLHVEHHDFPTMPWSALPKLNKIAKEFYSDLDSFDSWTKVVFEFFSPQFKNRYHRVLRMEPSKNKELFAEDSLVKQV